MASAASSATRSAGNTAAKPATGYAPPSSDIPDNAIYANGEPIPDPAGGGYLTYEV